MSEEEKSDVGQALEAETETNPEAHDDSPAGAYYDDETSSKEEILKKPKKKFVLTPARLETLRKGREKRTQMIKEKKAIEEKMRAEAKQEKQEIKQKVEEEYSRTKQMKKADTAEPKTPDSVQQPSIKVRKPRLKRSETLPVRDDSPPPTTGSQSYLVFV